MHGYGILIEGREVEGENDKPILEDKKWKI